MAVVLNLDIKDSDKPINKLGRSNLKKQGYKSVRRDQVPKNAHIKSLTSQCGT